MIRECTNGDLIISDSFDDNDDENNTDDDDDDQSVMFDTALVAEPISALGLAPSWGPMSTWPLRSSLG